MLVIHLSLKKGINNVKYIKAGFSWDELQQINLGLESQVDVSLYAKKGFPYYKMQRVRENLEAKKKKESN